jgi:mannonate dehydratase
MGSISAVSVGAIIRCHGRTGLKKSGIGYITYAHMANGIWSSEPEATRGGGKSRSFHLANAKGFWNGKVYKGPLTHGRKYSKEELWGNYTEFRGP